MIRNSIFIKLFTINNFRSFWVLQVFTLLAMQFYFLSLSWLTLDLTDSTMVLGLLLTIAAVPRLILVPIGGALFDRVNAQEIINYKHIYTGTKYCYIYNYVVLSTGTDMDVDFIFYIFWNIICIISTNVICINS